MFEVVPMFRWPPCVDPPPPFPPPPPPHDVATNATATPSATSLVALRIAITLPIRPSTPSADEYGCGQVRAAPGPTYRRGAYPEPGSAGKARPQAQRR